MKRIALFVAFGAAAVANAQTTFYSNQTTFGGSGYTAGGATTATPITAQVADDIFVGAAGAGAQITSFTFSTVNFNAAAVSYRPLVRFYAADGTDLAPGTLIGGLNFNPVTSNASSANLRTFTAPAGQFIFTVPANGLFWAAISFDNLGGSTASIAQLNNIGQAFFNAPTVGESEDIFFESDLPGSFDTGNPAGDFYDFGNATNPANPVANFGWSFRGNAVPEPATMAILGVGAAALLRRRRKSA